MTETLLEVEDVSDTLDLLDCAVPDVVEREDVTLVLGLGKTSFKKGGRKYPAAAITVKTTTITTTATTLAAPFPRPVELKRAILDCIRSSLGTAGLLGHL
jgi:hypothetical protein